MTVGVVSRDTCWGRPALKPRCWSRLLVVFRRRNLDEPVADSVRDHLSAVLHVKLDSNFLNSNLQATGQWRLQAGYPGEARVRFSEISVETLRDWLTKPGERSGLNFDGSTEGTVSIAGSALAPREWKASATLTKLEVFPIDQGPRKGVTERFTLRNAGPVVVTMEKSVISVASGHFTGPSKYR